MKYRIDNILITSNFKFFSCPDWDEKGLNHPCYQITLTTPDNAHRYTCNAYGSINDAENWDFEDKQTEIKKGIELVFMVLLEAITSPESFKDFCSNYGYDTDSIRALKMHKQLIKAYSGGFWLPLLKKDTIKAILEENYDSLNKKLKER